MFSTEAETGVMPPQVKEGQKPAEAGKGPHLGLWESVALLTPWLQPRDTDFACLASKIVRIYFYCFKPPGVWQFVATATGN